MGTLRLITPTPSDERGPLPPHAHRRSSRRGLRWLERLLLIVGIVCLGYYGYVSAEAALYQAYETRELDAILASMPPPPVPSLETPIAAAPEMVEQPRPRPAPGSMLGRLEIPRLRVAAIVRAGSDARTLRLAVGHIAGTALPGERGNVGLAAHRDTFFRRLGEIRSGDAVTLVTPDGTFVYQVAGTDIVEPKDVSVLDPTEEPALTLVTCYPFRYIGSAPKRFIVRAHLIEPSE
jgi:sortase A